MSLFSYMERLGGADIQRLEEVFRQQRDIGGGGSRVYEILKSEGLAGRKTVLLEDYRHYQAVSRAGSPEAAERAETWYQKVYKPVFEEQGRNSAKTANFLNNIRAGSVETEAEAEAAGSYAEKYESAFG